MATALHSFKGKPLAAYSYGRRLLWRALFNGGDNAADQVFSFALIFTLSLDQNSARAFLFDMRAFRDAFCVWIDEREPGDYKEAVATADKILEEAKAAEVSPAASAGGELKKKP